jgi:hypothetical protein
MEVSECVREPLIVSTTRGKPLAVDLPQGSDENGSVLIFDGFVIPIFFDACPAHGTHSNDWLVTRQSSFLIRNRGLALQCEIIGSASSDGTAGPEGRSVAVQPSWAIVMLAGQMTKRSRPLTTSDRARATDVSAIPEVSDASRRGAARMTQRWPQFRPTLERRFPDDGRVAGLCEAYETACAAEEYWRRLPEPMGPWRAEEHRQLAADVADDILTMLAPKLHGELVR